VIGEFERDYDHPSPIWWYTRECFIYAMLNKALRIQDVEIILNMGFFLRDLHRQIEHLHSNIDKRNRLTVYRGQGMLNVEFEKIITNDGGLLSFNNFLSTSLDPEAAYMRADSSRDDPELTGVFFRIEIDPSISKTPFALLDDVSYFSDSEKEILFSMHTIFRISELKQIDNRRLWEVQLALTSDDDEQLKRLTDCMRSEIGQGPDWAQLSILLLKMGELNKAEEICYAKSESTPDDASASNALRHYIIGLIRATKCDQNISLSYLEKTLELCQKSLQTDHPCLAELYSNIGSVYRSQGAYSTALSYNEKALEIMNKCLPPNHPNLSGMHTNIGVLYRSMGKYSTALIHLKKALEIRQKFLPPIHPDLARSHCNIGELHQSMGEYSTALIHLEKALKIQQKSLPSNHPVLAVSYNKIGMIYQSMKEYSIALPHLEKALEIQQKSLAPNHPDIATSLNDIGVVYQSMSNHSTALTYFKKALALREKSLAANHPDLAKSYNNIGLSHWLMGDHSTALSHHKKALEIRQNSLPPNHPDIAASYNNIGLAHRLMGEYSTALSY
jgi:tetratricopeptide (TPR) repeat protein